MITSVKLELTEPEVEQLLRLTQKGYEQAEGSLSQADRVAYNRLLGKLHFARAEGMSGSTPAKRPYTRRAAKKTQATKTGRKRGRPPKKAAAAAQVPTSTEA